MKQAVMVPLRFLLLMTVLTGILYPVAITAIARGIFPVQAKGTLLQRGNQVIGSRNIAQGFQAERYFWPRPSATRYSAFPSGASNFAPTSRALHDSVEQRRHAFACANFLPPAQDVPPDMLFSSASGLDPDISPAAAFSQVDRVSRARGMSAGMRARLVELVQSYVEPRQFEIFGEPRVNVLLLNLALDSLE
jgi:potassium-transporting ATPase KdpC subunit